jgi:hypothetical protein
MRILHALAFSALAAAPLAAQGPPTETEPSTAASWLERVSISVRYGELRPMGQSEIFSLIDRALAPGSRALRPRLINAELNLRVFEQWSLLLGAETGGRTIASVSRVQPQSGSGEVRQQTTFELTSVQYLGAQWQAFRWRGSEAGASDRLRVLLAAGGGVARYQLRQWGDFVDAERRIAFADDLRSAGRGGFGYASIGVEVPLQRWVALQGELRQQVGSAAMSADYATFDRIDLGGTKVSVGARFHPAQAFGGR